MIPVALTVSSDPRREMPNHTVDRLDRIEIALASLASEERRLGRLGFEIPLARCREQRRYWEFLRAMFQLPHGASPAVIEGGRR